MIYIGLLLVVIAAFYLLMHLGESLPSSVREPRVAVIVEKSGPSDPYRGLGKNQNDTPQIHAGFPTPMLS